MVKFNRFIAALSVVLVASIAMAEPAPKAADLGKLYGLFKKAGFSSLELMETTQQVMISGVAIEVSESFDGNLILKAGVHANSPEIARLTAVDDAQENMLKAVQAGAKFKAICDLTFSSGTHYMSFQRCVFK